jgi:hypothetical protein
MGITKEQHTRPGGETRSLVFHGKGLQARTRLAGGSGSGSVLEAAVSEVPSPGLCSPPLPGRRQSTSWLSLVC